MKTSVKACLTVVLAAMVAACGTTRTFVDYSGGTLYSTETAGNVPYIEIGPVAAAQRGFFWESCSALAEQAVAQLRTSAQQYGANGVMAVRWLNHADGTYTETPLCTTGWGWFAALIAGGFAPWVQTAEVRGRLVRADDTTLTVLRRDAGRRMAHVGGAPEPAATAPTVPAAPAATAP